MSRVFTTERRVEFCETDAAGIAHFSSFICYMEQAEHRFLRNIGTSVLQETDDGCHISWPRVHVECDFHRSAKFEDLLAISVRVLRLGTKSIRYGFAFVCESRPVAEGQIVAVCCKVSAKASLEAIAIPPTLRERIEPFLAAPEQV